MNPLETNPHFLRPSQEPVIEPFDSQQQQQHPRPTGGQWVDPPRRDGRPHRQKRRPWHQQQNRPEKQHVPATAAPLAPLHARHPDEQPRLKPFRGPRPEQSPAPTFPLLRSSGPEPSSQKPPQPRHHRRGSGSAVAAAAPWMPAPRKTNAPTWFLAVFCFVLWVVVILGGLVVLVVYLVFRPRSPLFEVSSATLNAAYLDMGYLLNADLTLLGNFTNPNRKVSVEFGHMFVELYYGRTLVATQHLEPFTARQAQNTLASLHMVTSQVRLAELEVQRIKRQALNNGIVFELKGYFRARSNFGGLFRYSYWLHSKCALLLTRPPGGVLVAKSCKTSH